MAAALAAARKGIAKKTVEAVAQIVPAEVILRSSVALRSRKTVRWEHPSSRITLPPPESHDPALNDQKSKSRLLNRHR